MERMRDDNILLAGQLHDVQKLAADETKKKLEDNLKAKHSELELFKIIESLKEEQAAQRKVIESLQAELSDKNTTRTGTKLEKYFSFSKRWHQVYQVVWFIWMKLQWI